MIPDISAGIHEGTGSMNFRNYGSAHFRLPLVAMLLAVAVGTILGAAPTSLIQGLQGPVRILWDTEGIPHVTAHSDHDAYFALGYLHASKRLFQIDYSRRLFSGTLAEVVGESALDSDIQFRTLGLRRAAEESYAGYSPEAQGMIGAYTAGINAYLSSPDFALPAEYPTLEVSSVAPWTDIDTLTVMKGIAFGLSFDLEDISRTETIEAYIAAGQAQGFDGETLFSQDVFRSAPFDPAVSIPDGLPVPTGVRTGAAGVRPPAERPNVDRVLVKKYLERLRRIPTLAPFLGSRSGSQGSNFWVVGPAQSETGHALFANDPHLSLEIPSLFFEVHLMVDRDPGSGPMNVTGVSFPGAPAVVQGCNERICWGSTVNPIDVTDVFEEQLVITFLPTRIVGTYHDDEVEPVVAIPQTFLVNQVGNGTPNDLVKATVGATEGGITYLVPRRNRAPIVSVNLGATAVTGLSVQFTGWRATREAEAFFHFARARNLKDFKEGLQYFDFGSQNFGYADVDGNIAYFTGGELPLREDLQAGSLQGRAPWFVRDGSHRFLNDWLPVTNRETLQAVDSAILPFDEMPQVVNPAQGFIANGNNDPIGVSLDNNVLNDERSGGGLLYLNPGFTSLRIGRIDQVLRRELTESPGSFNLDKMKSLQADNLLIDAQVLVPYIVDAQAHALGLVLSSAQAHALGNDAPATLRDLGSDPGVVEAINRLRDWNFATPTGIREGYDPGDDPSHLPFPQDSEIRSSIAATIYAAWRSRIIANTIDAALNRVGLADQRPDSERSMSALRNLLDHFGTRQGFGVSGIDFFQTEGLTNREDCRDYLILLSLRQALDQLAGPDFASAFGESSNQEDYRWGKLHRIEFRHRLGGVFDIPEAAGFSDLAPSLPGISRSGGYETVDASAHSVRAAGSNGFMFGSGPARRFVAELDPAGIRAYQIIPGGPSGDPNSPEYASQLSRWLTNRYHPVLIAPSKVEDNAVAEENLLPPSEILVFPVIHESADQFTGLALTNLGTEAKLVELTAYDGVGNPVALPSNPATLSLAGHEQVALLAREIFGTAAGSAPNGWVAATVPASSPAAANDPGDGLIAGLSQTGDFRLRSLDGWVAQSQPAKRLFFTRILQSEGTEGQPRAETELSIVNPTSSPVTVRLLLHDERPNPETSSVRTDSPDLSAWRDISIPAKGSIQKPPGEIFLGLPDNQSGGYVEAVVLEGEGVLGSALIRYPDVPTIVGLNAHRASEAATGYAPQMVALPNLSTDIKLLNTSDFTRSVQLRAIRGETIGEIVIGPFLLKPGEAITMDAGNAFPEFTTGPTNWLLAALAVEADGPGIVGDLLFLEPSEQKFGTLLPLQLFGFRTALFGHYANIEDFFTGIALFNPQASDARINIVMFSQSGQQIGSTEFVLGAGERIARTLAELIPESIGRAGGFFLVGSDLAIVGEEIFGTFDLRLQAAVAPTIVKP